MLDERGVPQRSADENKKLTCLEKFGTEYAAQSDIVKEHHKESCLEKYGVDNFAKSPLFNERMKATCQERYGVDNPMQATVSKENFKSRMLAKTGFEWPMQSDETKAKSKATCEERYGGQGWASSQTYNKYKDTVLEHYGVDNPMKSEHVKQTLSDNVFEQYGVRWFCLHPKYRSASNGTNSAPNLYFSSLLDDNNLSYQREFPIERFAYDFKVDNILLEVNPTPTHNSTWGVYNGDPLDKYYHYKKSLTAKEHGYRCIHLFDWDDPIKVISLLKSRETVYGRKCLIKEITSKTAREFINKHHIQNYAKDSIRLGLYFNEELVSVMTFDKPRYNKKFDYELVRYCSSKNVIGGAKKLFSYFLSHYNPSSVVSYCDFSKFTGVVYEDMGFILESTNVSKHWYNMKTSEHILDTLLLKRGFDQLLGKTYGVYGKGTDNLELMRKHGFVEVYDAGQGRYAYYKKN